VGIRNPSARHVRPVNKQKVQINILKMKKEILAGTTDNSSTTADNSQVSPLAQNRLLSAAGLPVYIQKAIRIVLKRHPEYQTKAGAFGNCVIASDELLFYIDQKLGNICDGYMDGVSDYKGKGSHNWAVVEGYCIDLTARQFDEKEPCPKIWTGL
jgi:hypothetical protein